MASFRKLLKQFGEQNPPKMRYGGDHCPGSFFAWQKEFRAKLEELRGPAIARPKADVTLLSRQELDDHFRDHVAIRSVLDTKVRAYVLVPKNQTEPTAPGVLAFHGHVECGKERISGAMSTPAADFRRDYGLSCVRRGFVTLCPDWWRWGERKEENFDFGGREICNTKFVAGEMYGLPLLSIMLSDAQASLDALLRSRRWIRIA